MNDAVLDASALLALLNEEIGSDMVARYVPGAVINAVNLCEVVGKLAENQVPEKEIREIFFLLDLKIVSFDPELSFQAGFLRPETKKQGLSLGDRACLATGMKMNLPVLIADKIWNDAGLPVVILLIR